MTTGIGYAGDISPQRAWEVLRDDPRAVLVDVRTPAEWSYVGVPDLGTLGKPVVFVPWLVYPGQHLNARFVEEVAGSGVARDAPVIFLCRSGVRSRSAAIAMTAAGFERCFNVDSGFEGHHDAARHRGTIDGWKVAGLPWIQG